MGVDAAPMAAPVLNNRPVSPRLDATELLPDGQSVLQQQPQTDAQAPSRLMPGGLEHYSAVEDGRVGAVQLQNPREPVHQQQAGVQHGASTSDIPAEAESRGTDKQTEAAISSVQQSAPGQAVRAQYSREELLFLRDSAGQVQEPSGMPDAVRRALGPAATSMAAVDMSQQPRGRPGRQGQGHRRRGQAQGSGWH